MIDYILFYVFARSQSPDRMEYKVLIKLINDGLEQQKRIQSANKKNRPESSSPEKLKMRNPDMQQKAKAEIEDEVDQYSEEDMGIEQDEAVEEEESQELKYLKDVNDLEQSKPQDRDRSQEFEESPRQKVPSPKSNNEQAQSAGEA